MTQPQSKVTLLFLLLLLYLLFCWAERSPPISNDDAPIKSDAPTPLPSAKPSPSAKQSGANEDSLQYDTPDMAIKFCVDYLIGKVTDNPQFYEPCAGNGSIVKFFRKLGAKILGSDKFIEFEGNKQVDFLELDASQIHSSWFIITKPPFDLMKDFLNKCVSLPNSFAILARLEDVATQDFKQIYDVHGANMDILIMTRSLTGLNTDHCVWIIKAPFCKKQWLLV